MSRKGIDGPSALAYLRGLCRRLDLGAAVLRVPKVALVAIPVAGLSLSVPAAAEMDRPRPMYGVEMMPHEEACDDGRDEDRDGLVDCDDPDCEEACRLAAERLAEIPSSPSGGCRGR
jgi:hypothetical protein